jgi:BirA family transcriptional regulator, biotin operon repressor / biotin---[acetyl-CoA-carboxylase] ligase
VSSSDPASHQLPVELAHPFDSWLADGRLSPLGGRLRFLPTVSSTNSIAADLASDGAPDGTLVIADQQTAGRGRSGHTWFSPPGAGLYVSVLLRTGPGTDHDSSWVRLLTLAAGVALAEGLHQASGLPVALKWPNDLIVAPSGKVKGARKLAGILAEGHTGGRGVDAAVLGYGVNVGLTVYPADIRHRATSLEAELGRPIDRGLVLACTVEALARWVARLRGHGGGAVARRWRALALGVSGAAVEWGEASMRCRGLTAGLDDDGALLVRRGTAVSRVIAGEVTWL